MHLCELFVVSTINKGQIEKKLTYTHKEYKEKKTLNRPLDDLNTYGK